MPGQRRARQSSRLHFTGALHFCPANPPCSSRRPATTGLSATPPCTVGRRTTSRWWRSCSGAASSASGQGGRYGLSRSPTYRSRQWLRATWEKRLGGLLRQVLVGCGCDSVLSKLLDTVRVFSRASFTSLRRLAGNSHRREIQGASLHEAASQGKEARGGQEDTAIGGKEQWKEELFLGPFQGSINQILTRNVADGPSHAGSSFLHLWGCSRVSAAR